LSAPRFFVGDAETVALGAGAEFPLPEAAAHHALRVLRLARGDALTLFDGAGGEWAATLAHVERREAIVRVECFDPIERELTVRVTLALAVIASDAMDIAVRKAVELGATAIAPVIASRTQGGLRGDKADRRLAHWRQIAVAACEQCGRNRVPAVAAVASFADWCALQGADTALLAPGGDLSLAAWVASPAVRKRGPDVGITVAVGPEGGYTDAEFDEAAARNVARVHLGPSVLRAETAALAAMATIAAISGDVR
jgi:16S rRNA (uracil1498-N3)-methyltransferase